VDGVRFPSKKEAAYYEALKARRDEGDVVFFLMQCPFHLPGKIKYIVDFVVFLTDGTVEFVDVKGYETKEFRLKKRLVEAEYPVELKVVK
jgi:hypothetical protein